MSEVVNAGLGTLISKLKEKEILSDEDVVDILDAMVKRAVSDPAKQRKVIELLSNALKEEE